MDKGLFGCGVLEDQGIKEFARNVVAGNLEEVEGMLNNLLNNPKEHGKHGATRQINRLKKEAGYLKERLAKLED